jgi:hypothetical protein
MNDEELKALLEADETPQIREGDRVKRGMRRARASFSQQQTLGFVLIKIWVAIAKFLAPFFAGLAKRQAGANLPASTRRPITNRKRDI